MANNENTSYIKRTPIDLLPSYFQTDSLRKVFNATVNHLFQPESVEFLDGYVGHIPPWYKPTTDFYIPEPDANRTNYQLDPTIVSAPYQSPELTNAMFYEDLIGQLNFQGGITNNHNRLFSQEYYSWSPPIDLDMFVNYTNYYWLPNGPDGIILYNTTDLENTAVGQTQYSYVGTALYTANNTTVVFTADAPLVFTTGLKVIPTNDLTLSLNFQQLIISGVGRSIQLVDITNTSARSWDFSGWNTFAWSGVALSDPVYVTIERGSNDGNQWSSGNRWFHIDVINMSQSFASDLFSQQAMRPILQFDANTELWNYGTNNRGVITVADTRNTNLLASIVGQPSWQIEGIELQDGMRIIGLADQTANAAGKIFIVTGQSAGAIELTVDTYGCQSPNGEPTQGDRAVVQYGTLQGENIYYNSGVWTSNCQQQIGLMPPLFQLYDVNGNSMSDPSVYPSSSFVGSKVFSYATDPSQPIDPYIGEPLELDQFGDWIFNNNLATDTVTYVNNGTRTLYNGYLFAQVGTPNSVNYIDSWYTAPQLSRQYIINQFVLTSASSTFTIDQTPAAQEPNTLPTIFVSVNINQRETLLVNGVDYTVSRNVVTLVTPAESGSIIEIASWNPVAPDVITGYYQIPLNLSANPNNLPITTVSRSQFLQQFQEIIENQTGIVGPALGTNNYRDTAQQRGLGLSILQHRAPMLKLGLLNSVPLATINLTTAPTDPMQAMQYAENSYTRFYNRLLNALFSIAAQQGFSANSNPAVCDPYNTNLWLNTALAQINIGKTPASPWANTGYGGVPGAYGLVQASTPLYIPATATRLGITSAYQPIVYFDTSYSVPKLTIQTHDGARIVMTDSQGAQLGTILHNQKSTTNPEQLTNPVAAAWLQFELNMFNNLPPAYSNTQASLVFDITTYSPGKWRSSDYTASEYLQLQRGAFDKWAINNQINFTANTTYNATDPFTWNYRSVNDPSGNPIPGYYQGIYRWFYDTDRPHLCPWEMLGFSQQPDWWTEQYGPSPYTSGNTAMWQDLTNGIIRQGPRAGTYEAWARPGLTKCIPVDTQGNLLPPVQAGCAASIPTTFAAQAPWIFGDGAPVESAWIHSQFYPFVLSMTGYLMKPAAFIEYTWDSLRTEEIYASTSESQWIYIDTNTRRSSNQFYINRETPNSLVTGTVVPNESSLNYFASAGFEVWITEYVVSQGLGVTNYIGTLIRGGNVQLAHRMAGYVNSTNFRGIVDSFGQLGYNSQIIPQENISTYLYRSTSTGMYFYSGIVVEQTLGGWSVYGYDATNPSFTIIPSNTSGPRNSVVIGNQKVIEYLSALTGTTQSVPYNTIMTSYQQVYDFIISYGRWLESQGWIFEQYNTDVGNLVNWTQSAKEFLLWAQGSWANGTVIALSPNGALAEFYKSVGMIQYVNGIVAGTYPVVDRSGNPIQAQNINVLRDNGSITVQPTNSQEVYGLRLFTTTMEHAVFFDNLTQFGDVIYEPLYNLQQQRIKIYTYRANGWDGTVDAPGYIVIQNNTTVNGQTFVSNTWTMTNNFEKTASDFTRYFNIDEPKNYDVITYGGTNTITSSTTLGAVDDQNIANLSKHLIAYQPRAYLQNLLLDESVEFQFYQGFIRQKGTLATINALLRSSTVIPTGSTFNYYDEWMIRVGAYGATALNVDIEFILPQGSINYDPQWIRFFSATSNNPSANVFDIVPNDPLLVTPPATYSTSMFGLRQSYAPNPDTDVLTAGYVQLGETDWYVVNSSDLLSLYLTQSVTSSPINAYDTVWQFITGNSSWMVWIYVPSISQVSYTIQSASFGQPTTIVTQEPHGLLNGDICVVNNVSGVTEINDTYVISAVTSNTFNISLSTFSQGIGGNIFVYRPMRFANIFDRDTSPPPGGYIEGNLVYVDQGGIISNAWTVYTYVNGTFIPYRQQARQVNPDLIQSSEIYNLNTGDNLANLDYWDPAKGKIPGQAQQEITYITDFDPARYTNGNTTSYAVNYTLAWSSAQLGQVWWDISKVRYIDYEQGDESYRLRTWGQIAPGTQVVIYEWIQSSISPVDWASAVVNQTTVTVNGNRILPSGFVQEPYNWSQITEYNSQNTPTVYYYFWVGNSAIAPSSIGRNLSTQYIASLITNPSQTGLPWYAAISSNSIILGNAQSLLNGNRIAQRINYTTQVNNANIYSQWELVREGDPNSPINAIVWSRLKASLVTFDGMGNDVPNYRLNVYNKYGTLIRPRQTWFVNRESASALFISTFNSLIASSTTPIVYDSTKTGWLNYFNAVEQLPPQYITITLSVNGTKSPDVVSVGSTIGMVINKPIVFTTAVGGLSANTTYYVREILSQTTFTVSAIPSGLTIALTTSTVSTTATETITNWDYQVSDITQRDNLIGAIVPGQLILVDSNSQTKNLWTIWEYTPLSSQSWQLIQIQSYNTADYWQTVNWYAAGYSSENIPTLTVGTVAELDAISRPVPGLLVKVANSGDGTYQWYVYAGGTWTLVAQQNGSIEVLPSIYQWGEVGGFDAVPFDGAGTSLVFTPSPSFDNNASIEFSNIIDGIYNAIYSGPNSIELNTLFFSMINYVVSEQRNVDWIFKTSNMVFTGFNQPLEATTILAVDNTQSILEFINEAKPYHAQIQAYINGYAANDTANVSVVDFDVPFSYLTASTPGSVSSPANISVSSSNLEAIEYKDTYTAWYNNYNAASSVTEQYYIDPTLVRNLATKIIFDRISTPALLPGWSKQGWSIGGWSDETANQTFGAMSRISEYYQPTPGMIPNVISDLMQGVVYKGQLIGNLGFNANPGWSSGPWGGLLGWDADMAVVDAYLDQIIQGGQVPNYDVAIGNGMTVSFPLLKGAQNPNNLVVWSDGGLRLYGVDWIVPTFATNAYVKNGGSGYAVGDQINIVGGTAVVPVRLQVTAVLNGAITAVSILGKGSYSTVLPGVFQTTYPALYPGFGTNATIGIDWDCSTIQFNAPPASSSSPNVYILYVGTTFGEAPTNASDSIYDGYKFVQPYVDDNHPEELYPMLPRDCLMMDTYSVEISGRPLVSNRVYITDGITDQYDLLIVPQSDQAVMVYLGSVPLVVGLSGDVVINYITKRLVFVTTPAAGQILYITCIGFGGGGRSVANSYVVSGGNSYTVGDTITVSAGMPYNPAVLQVTDIGNNNSVVSTSVVEAGLYPRLPIQPVGQSATSGAGMGAEFNLEFTDSFNMYNFVGDGVTVDFIIPGLILNQSGIMVVIDGLNIPFNTSGPGYSFISYPVPGIAINPAPAYDSTIIVAVFANSNFSTVNETVINVTNDSVLSYNIVAPANTTPVYVSTLVRKNGQLMSPPVIEEFVGSGNQQLFLLNLSFTGTSVSVYIDNVLQPGSAYNLTSSIISFVVPPIVGANIVLVGINSQTRYTILNNTITFLSGSISNGDQIVVTTYSQDIDYEFRTEEFVANNANNYTLTAYPNDTSTIQVWYGGVLMVPQQDYTLTPVAGKLVVKITPSIFGWGAVWEDVIAWDYLPAVVVTYMVGNYSVPAIAWRTTTGWDATLSTALDTTNQTFIVSNVHTYSSSIYVADVTKVTAPIPGAPGLVYINDELISFTEIQLAPYFDPITKQLLYPNSGYLTGIARDRLGTSGSPLTLYNTLWYNGNGATTEFAIESATQAISTTVFVNEILQVENVDYVIPVNSMYLTFTTPPPVGTKNIQITALNQISYNTTVSHQIPSNVTDAGTDVQIPGGYSWVSTPNGLQYSDSSLAVFLLEHSTGA